MFEENTDVFFYSGLITPEGALEITKLTENSTNKAVKLVLCTNGGNPDAAYKIANILQVRYNKFDLIVNGYCKSAGTLIACGSDNIAFGPFGEFGPLDSQINDNFDPTTQHSTLDIFQAITTLKGQVYGSFRDLINAFNADGNCLFNKAEKIKAAIELTKVVYAPIASKITPIKLGNSERALSVAKHYMERLVNRGRGNLWVQSDPEKGYILKNIDELMTGFQSHSAVIDYDMAKKLFKSVRQMTPSELQYCKLLDKQAIFQTDFLKVAKLNTNLTKKVDNTDVKPANEAINDE